MKLAHLALFLVCISVSVGAKKLAKLRDEIGQLETMFTTVMNDTSGSIEELQLALDQVVTSIGEMKEAQKQRDIDLSWQSLHMAAAGACRGSTPLGGKGPWANSVIPKQNGAKCSDQCAKTARTLCKAEVALTGYPKKATSYTQDVGYYYNYDCNGGGNADITMNEVVAEEPHILERKTAYYRFCCCAKA